MEQIPFVAHEADMTRMERVIRRLWILCIILALALVGTNAAWVVYENSFETVNTSVMQENESEYNNFIGNDGDIKNGTTNGDD